jgi:hypothetical protein
MMTEGELRHWPFVYLFRGRVSPGEVRYKIGSTSSLAERNRRLQCGSPVRLEVAYWRRSYYAYDVEQALLRRFAHRRVQSQGEREWFDLSPREAAGFRLASWEEEYAIRAAWARHLRELLGQRDLWGQPPSELPEAVEHRPLGTRPLKGRPKLLLDAAAKKREQMEGWQRSLFSGFGPEYRDPR